MKIFIAAAAILIAAMLPLQAERTSWQASLGGSVLGQVHFDSSQTQHGPQYTLRADLNHTPLGVFDGTFSAQSQHRSQAVIQYTAQTRLSRGASDVSFRTRDGMVVRNTIKPSRYRSFLSQDGNALKVVLNPAASFARFVSPPTCPAPFNLYDAKRIAAVSLASTRRSGATLTCDMRFSVISGPGYLSVFRFTSLKAKLTYSIRANGSLLLDGMDVRAGFLTLKLRRISAAAN